MTPACHHLIARCPSPPRLRSFSRSSYITRQCQFVLVRPAVQVDTVDENENETAGRGMIANREIKEGDELFTLPIDLLLTKEAAKKVRRRKLAPVGWMDRPLNPPLATPFCSLSLVGPCLFFFFSVLPPISISVFLHLASRSRRHGKIEIPAEKRLGPSTQIPKGFNACCCLCVVLLDPSVLYTWC